MNGKMRRENAHKRSATIAILDARAVRFEHEATPFGVDQRMALALRSQPLRTLPALTLAEEPLAGPGWVDDWPGRRCRRAPGANRQGVDLEKTFRAYPVSRAGARTATDGVVPRSNMEPKPSAVG